MDLDRDGDYDLIIGGINGRLLYYRNTGTASSPSWSRDDAVVADVRIRQDAAPAFADMDGDGKPDVIVGEYNGNFSYYKNRLPTTVYEATELPAKFELMQNYPNPFNPTTKLSFVISHWSLVSLRVFDALGREVATLVNEDLRAGKYGIIFDGRGLASGVYIYRLKTNSYGDAKRMVVLK